ncbi:MAG TPA: L-asparaginase 1, partial [Bacteroides coprosuis]|nr:L-asparaginase 1 [Bacteroides coprosuis]
TECAVTKLMFLLGHGYDYEKVKKLMSSDLAGEISKMEDY